MTERPQAQYRQEFRQKLVNLQPENVLDVGCGTGDLLAYLGNNGIKSEGVDIDDGAVSMAMSAGHLALHASSDSLPFEDNSFDWVAMEFSAHHLSNLKKSMWEMARVAKKGIAILDPWYDLSLPSQRLADKLDRWMKAIDEENGMVHKPAIDAEDLITALADLDFRFSYRYQLIPVELPIARILEWGKDCMKRTKNRENAATGFATILIEAKESGVSDDGAILFFAEKLAS